MSKFSERLSALGQAGPAKMGFGSSGEREKNPVMLVIARDGDPSKDADSSDLTLNASVQKSGDWGLVVDAKTKLDIEALEKNGCQFLLIGSEAVAAEALLAEDFGLGMVVTEGLSETRIRAIEDGPFDFLLLAPDSLSWPLTVGSTLQLQEVVSSFSKHIFLELPAGSSLPGEKDLEVLKNLPVSGLVVDGAKGDAKALREAISKLEPRKPSGKPERAALVPFGGRNNSSETDAGSDDYDDEEWDD